MLLRVLSAFVILAFGDSLAALAQDDARHPRAPAAALGPDEKLPTVDTRPGVTVRLHIRTTQDPPKGIVLMFPGGNGFLVKAYGYDDFLRPEFMQHGYATAVVDAPSDQGRGMAEPPYDRFRASASYARDIAAVVAVLKQEVPGPIYLFGHSMGTISAAHAAATVKDPDIRALVLASTPAGIRKRGGRGMTLLDVAIKRISIPVLLIQNRDDPCSGAGPQGAASYPPLLTSSPRVAFLEAPGGTDDGTARTCGGGNNHHSFYGIRDRLVRDAIRWLDGEDLIRIED